MLVFFPRILNNVVLVRLARYPVTSVEKDLSFRIES